MTREEVKVFLHKVKQIYKEKFSVDSQEAFDAWCDCMSDIRADVANKALTEFVKSSKFTPTIADIREISERLWNEYILMVKHINNEFDSATGNYPSLTEEQWERGHITFIGIVNRYPREQKERIANALGNKIRTFVQEWERGSEQTIIGLDEFMERMKDEFSG